MYPVNVFYQHFPCSTVSTVLMLRTSQVFNLITEGKLKHNRIHKKLNNDKHAIQEQLPLDEFFLQLDVYRLKAS